MWLTVVLLAVLLLAVLLLAVLLKVYLELFSSSSPNPFSEDVKRPPAPLVTDKEFRKKVLKQALLLKNLPFTVTDCCGSVPSPGLCSSAIVPHQ